MTDVASKLSIAGGSVAAGLAGFGGHLECLTCGRTKELGDIGAKVKYGWPRCHGYTMRWWTARQVAAGEHLPVPLSVQETRE